MREGGRTHLSPLSARGWRGAAQARLRLTLSVGVIRLRAQIEDRSRIRTPVAAIPPLGGVGLWGEWPFARDEALDLTNVGS